LCDSISNNDKAATMVKLDKSELNETNLLLTDEITKGKFYFEQNNKLTKELEEAKLTIIELREYKITSEEKFSGNKLLENTFNKNSNESCLMNAI
jgi:hypothetical protein